MHPILLTSRIVNALSKVLVLAPYTCWGLLERTDGVCALEGGWKSASPPVDALTMGHFTTTGPKQQY